MKGGRVAIIAGGGDLPLIFVNNALKKGIKPVVFEIEGEGNPAISRTGLEVIRIAITDLGSIIDKSLDLGVKSVIFLGYVRPASLLKQVRFDMKTVRVLLSLKDKRPSALMSSVIREFESSGIRVLPTTYLMQDALAGSGYLSGGGSEIKWLKPFIDITAKIADMDIGQTTVVSEGMIWAVEAMEGTDNCIKRGASLAKKGFVVIKMARKNQDLRYDLPVMGMKTLKLIKSLGGRGIVVEAGKTLMMEKQKCLQFARSNRIFIYGWRRKK